MHGQAADSPVGGLARARMCRVMRGMRLDDVPGRSHA